VVANLRSAGLALGPVGALRARREPCLGGSRDLQVRRGRPWGLAWVRGRQDGLAWVAWVGRETLCDLQEQAGQDRWPGLERPVEREGVGPGRRAYMAPPARLPATHDPCSGPHPRTRRYV
jgi:hypothetical protein